MTITARLHDRPINFDSVGTSGLMRLATWTHANVPLAGDDMW
jgi:hypothetical protein